MVGGPVQGVIAVIDSVASLWRIMHRTEVLPFRGAHLRARILGAWRLLLVECDDHIVFPYYKKAAELVKPQKRVYSIWCFNQFIGRLRVDRYGVVSLLGFGKGSIKSFEMLLKLK